jgi:hypothetical protein
VKQNVKQKVVTTRVGVMKTKGPSLNKEGFDGFVHKPKTELFLLGVSRFFGESSFYEDDSSIRYRNLIHKVTESDPEWVASFLKWLRNDANIRTAAIVGAAEYVKAGGPNGRTVVRSVISRPDEPAELLAYWLNNHGRNVPQPIKRGIKDMAQELYTERNFARWDSKNNAVRMADVIELTHPKPSGVHQSNLFQYIIEDRHGRGDFTFKTLNWLYDRAQCRSRQDYIEQLNKGNTTISWENVSSAGTGPMTAEEWTQVIPFMGYMATLRNLRNFDKAGVDHKIRHSVGIGLSDPYNVEKSKQLPIRYYSAYRAVTNNAWKPFLSQALSLSLNNVPALSGKWLVLVDASGSMFYSVSNDSEVNYYDTACVFAAALASKNNVTLRTYSNDISPVLDTRDVDVLKIVEKLSDEKYAFQGSTLTASCLERAFNKGRYNGVILLTDEQHNDYWGGNPDKAIPDDVPLYTFNLAGYKVGHDIRPNRITVGGLSDSAFTLIKAVEDSKAKWPWE